MGKAKRQEIARAEDEAQRDFVAARARIEAQALERLATEATAAAVETGRRRVELENQSVQAFRAGELAAWPRFAELDAAIVADDLAHAKLDAAIDRRLKEMKAAEPALWRVLCLKAEAHDAARTAHGAGGKKAARTKAPTTRRTRQAVEAAARRGSTKSQAARDLRLSRNTVGKYWPHQ